MTLAEKNPDNVRVGDRYVYEDRKITISSVDGGMVDFQVLTEDGKAWSSKTTLPLPRTWTKAGSGPVPQLYCAHHPLREVEPGQLYCPECIDQIASNWAGLAPDEAQAATAILLEEMRNRDHGV